MDKLNIYYVQIGEKYFVKEVKYVEAEGAFMFTEPSKISITRFLGQAKIFTNVKRAKEIAEIYGGKVLAPEGGLVPIDLSNNYKDDNS